MTQEALKKMYQLLLTEPHATTVCAQLERIAREALAEHAMRETQRLGQEIEPVTDDIASIIACRDMLDAQPVPPRTEQEPVAWMWRCKPYCDWPNWGVSLKRPADSGCYGDKRTEGYEDVPLYTTPPQRKPLLASEIVTMYAECPTSDNDMIAFARAIEAAHDIKGDA